MSNPTPQPRLPFTRLVELAQRNGHKPTDSNISDVEAVGLLFGKQVPRTTIDRWHRLGGVPIDSADKVAIKQLGIHPGSIWPEWWRTEQETAA